MKTCFVLMTILFAWALSSVWAADVGDEAQIQAINRLEKVSQTPVKLVFDERTGIPRFMNLRVPVAAGLGAEAAAYQFLEEYKAIFKMESPAAELSVKEIKRDRLGMTHLKMRQSVAGVPVFGRELIVHIDQNRNIYAINGEFAPRINIETTPAIGPENAIQAAIADVGPAVYRWDTMFEEMLPAGQSWRPTAELMVYEHQGQFRLVYRTMIAIEEPEPANWVYFIDARTGAVLYRYNDLQHADAVGTGHSLYRGAVNINTNQTSRSYEMKDNPQNLWTYNARNKTRLPGLLFKDADNTWGDGTKSDPQSAAVDAHFGAAATHGYYLNTHGRNSFDDAGARITSTVHYRNNYVNAFWNGQQVVYGDGDGVTADPLVDLDVVSHEITHGVTEHTAGLIYQDQSGALNESVSDVFAMMVDTDDFTIGEDSWTPGVPGDALRYMDDPTEGGQPNHMEDFLVTDDDNGGVHTNSGIPNFAAYLATAGGTGKLGDVVTGIGRNKIEGIWYRALSVYMTPSTDFVAARLTTAQAAADLYGGGSPEVGTIEDAWTAVGVGGWPSGPAVNVPISTAANDQVRPQLTSDGAGGAIITWQDYRSGNADIYAQRVDANGVALWAINDVPICTAANDQYSPQLTSDGAGGAIITWQDYRSGNWDIYAQRVDANGIALWAINGVPICTAANDQYSPQLTSDGAGGAIITWADLRSGNADIYAQRVNASGVVLWAIDGVPIPTAVSYQETPQLVSDGAGGAIITWHDNFDIYAQRVNASGVVLWTTNGVPISTAANDQNSLQLTSDGAGGAIITWADLRSGNVDIYAQRVSANGVALWATNGVPICTAANYKASPQLTSDGAGGAIITWQDQRSGNDIYAQRVDANGIALWAINGVPICTAANDQYSPQLTSDGAGGAIITWYDYRSGTHSDIYAQRVNVSGTVLWITDGVPICTAADYQWDPQLVSDGAGGAIITWQDHRSDPSYDIYAQNVQEDGSLGGISGDGFSPLAAAPIRPTVQVTPQPLKAQSQPIPLVTRAFQNYPNPFNPETWLPYQLAKAAQVIIHIYDVQGRLVRTLDLGEQPPGVYLEKSRAAYWDGRNYLGEVVPGGIYFYTLQAGAFQATRKLVILK